MGVGGSPRPGIQDEFPTLSQLGDGNKKALRIAGAPFLGISPRAVG